MYGKLHRERFPAVIKYDNQQTFYTNGTCNFGIGFDKGFFWTHHGSSGGKYEAEKYTDNDYEGELDEFVDFGDDEEEDDDDEYDE